MSSLEALMTELDKVVGPNSANQAVNRFIDTGYPPLNNIMSGRMDGGLPFGRLLEMFGESSTGKTALATQWMVNAQKMGGVAIFIDFERSFDVEMAKTIGLNDERPYWIYVKPKTWEEGNMIAAKACKAIRGSKLISEDAPILVVFDSIAAALPKSMADKEMDEYSMNDTTALARVTSTTLKSMAHHAEEFGSTLLYLNQIRLKPGVAYGDPRTTPGGKAMEYYSTVRLSLGRSKIMETRDGEKEFTGQQITIKCEKSKMTAPFKDCSLRLMFDELGMASFDTVTPLIEYLVAAGKLVSSGPRVTWTDGKSYYKKALSEKIIEENLYDDLKAMIG